MRMTEVLLVIPRFLFAIVLVTLFGATIWNVIFIIGILSWPTIARIVRAEVLSLRNREFVEAARSLGASNFNIMLTEILPNTLHVVTVSASLQVAAAIIIEAGLSFLGLSDPNILSWGRMLSIAQAVIFAGAWWMIIFPGIAILVTVLSFNVVGDGLNEALNPKLR
jgi:peptide/nickel transport system permease protein